jgi:hypothetical protein
VCEIRAKQAQQVLRGGPGWESTIEKIMRSAGLDAGDGYGTVKITEGQPEYDLTLPCYGVAECHSCTGLPARKI